MKVNQLKTIRVLRGETQLSLAQKTGLHYSKICLIEKGHVIPREDEKERLEKALNAAGCIDWGITNGG